MTPAPHFVFVALTPKVCMPRPSPACAVVPARFFYDFYSALNVYFLCIFELGPDAKIDGAFTAELLISNR